MAGYAVIAVAVPAFTYTGWAMGPDGFNTCTSAGNVAPSFIVRRSSCEYGCRMILEKNGRVRLTKDEHNRLRMSAARNGYVIETIRTADNPLEAAILGLTDDRARQMLAFVEADSVSVDSQA